MISPPRLIRYSYTYYVIYTLPRRSYTVQEIKTRKVCGTQATKALSKLSGSVLDKTNAVRDRCHYNQGTYYI